MLTEPNAELAELRQAHERLRRKVDFLFDRLGLVYTDQDVPLYVLHAQELIRAGQYGDALRVIREHTAVGIPEARAIIVDLSKRLGVAIPSDDQMGSSSVHNPWADVAQFAESQAQAPSSAPTAAPAAAPADIWADAPSSSDSANSFSAWR